MLSIVSFITLLWLNFSLIARADVLYNVDLRSFEARPLDQAVELEWITDTEFNTLAFRLERTDDNVNYIQLDQLGIDGYIFAVGDGATGSDYLMVDTANVVNGTTYTYKLIEVETDLNEIELATDTVTAGLDQAPVTSPVPIGNGGGGGNPIIQNTNTPRPTDTDTPATHTATAVSTNTPTITPSPTNTGIPATNIPPTNTATTTAPTPLPTATSLPTPDTSASEIIAQVQPTEVVEPTSYPGPEDPTIDANLDSDDFALEAVETTEPPTPYPLASNTPVPPSETTTPIPIIGGNITLDSASNSPEATNGRLYLWGGFLATILIFAAAVIGSILLFTRKRGPTE